MKTGCVVGCGAIGPVHAEGIRLAEFGRLDGICEIDEEKRNKYCEQYGVKGFSSFDQVLCDPEIDVVHICTPHYLHAPMTREALLAGKAVVLEKPAAISSRELRELVSFVEENGYRDRVMIMLQNRRNSCVQALKKLTTSEQELGALKGIAAHVTWRRDEAYYDSAAWRGTWAYEGGGLLINQAVHTIDLMLWLGGAVKEIRAAASRRAVTNIEVEDTADALVVFENGARGVFTATNGYGATTPAMLELEFEKARFRYADQALYRIEGQDISVVCRDDLQFRGKSCWGNGHARVIDDFYRFLEGSGGQMIPLTEAVPAMEFVFEVYRQAFGRE